MNQTIDFPSAELAQEYIDKFDSNKELVMVEEVLSELFGKYPNNKELRDILIKVSTLNSLYSTQIYATIEMAKHIQELKIDVRLQQGSPEIVNKIADITIKERTRHNYSFASKYCHWHQPDFYPVYDSYVDQLLWAYHNQLGFMDFQQAQLRQYPRYKEIIEEFRKNYGLSQFNFRELDKFLWGYGKERFGNTQ